MIVVTNILDIEKYVDDIEVVIFDLDDTLYSEKEYVRSGYQAIASLYPHIENFENKLWKAFLDGRQAIDYVLKQENIYCEKNKCLELYRSHFPNIHLYSGVKELLDRLKKHKHVGIITDGRPEGQRAKLKALELDAEKFIITDEFGGVEFRKPCEKAFVEMQKFFNIDFSRMVYIGDNLNKDFIAPIKLGMKTIHFNNKDSLYYRDE